MNLRSVLVANRGEIAVRILRTAGDLGLRTVAVHTPDDASGLHVRLADEARELPGAGAAGYLDAEAVLDAAAGCDVIHPGYGFLSENADFAAKAEAAGFVVAGPGPDVLRLFGDKTAARGLATRLGVPVSEGTGPVDLDGARALLAGGPVMVKAVAGGGGRGMRVATTDAELAEAYGVCAAEAERAFGDGRLYVERYIQHARHVEVQIAGDGTGAVVAIGDRDCSLQRRHQKLIEIAPAPGLPKALRDGLHGAAVRMAREARYRGLGTFEFLAGAGGFVFLEANPRLQVEHTVTEEVHGIDLVDVQLRLAGGATLESLGLTTAPPATGIAVQARVNAEVMAADGTTRPSTGTLTAFTPPSGPGVRVDTHGHVGYAANLAYDSLLAKVIVRERSDDLAAALRRTGRALAEFTVRGLPLNLEFLRALLARPEVLAGDGHTGLVEEIAGEVAEEAARLPRLLPDAEEAKPATGTVAAAEVPEGTVPVPAPLSGTVVSLEATPGDTVPAGTALLVLESMKMHHVVAAPVGGTLRDFPVKLGDTLAEGTPVAFLAEAEVTDADDGGAEELDLDRIRPDLQETIDRHAYGLDENRPDAVAKRRRTGHRTARENLDDLIDPGTFVEYGPLTIAAQRRRRPLQDLIERTPADGLVGGVANVNGELVGEDRARCVVISYDYTVLAGTQGKLNHRKKDRLFELAERRRLPLVLFAEGGGGRPGDTDTAAMAGLDGPSFYRFGRLSGHVPLVGIVSGRCFAGNAALLGSCDVVIATADANIGMGGPAMIEGGGLGVYAPEEVGPMSVQVPNGVVDIPVEDEAEATAVAKKYLSYFQGPVDAWEAADQRLLRHAVPENRLRVYDIRAAIDTIADTGSVLELRRAFGPTMITALIRVEGRPMGLIANDPRHLGGAIDSDGSDKAARFMQLCDAFGLPIVSLCDTPGFMVGPDVEHTAAVRHMSRLFVVGANLSVPICMIITRKAYGLGAMGMAGGGTKVPVATVAWPTGEMGGMGLEGAVRLGYRKELEAVEDPAARQALYEEKVAEMYARGKAINAASVFEIDDVIDPMNTRHWITSAFDATPDPAVHPRRPNIDAW